MDEVSPEERDPLLVRPFVLHDGGENGPDESSAQTWPAATADETRQLPAVAVPATPTPVARGRGGRSRWRRPLIVAGAGASALTALVAVGYSALGSDPMRPSGSAALPAEPLPAVIRPSSALPSMPAASALPSDTDLGGTDRDGETRQGSATPSPSLPVSASASAATASTTTAGPSSAPAPEPPFNAADAARPATQTGALVSGNGLCLDLNGAVPTDDNHVQVFDCNGTSAQRWTLGDDNTLRVMGKCALLLGDTTVRIISCDGRTPAQWRYDEGLLINAANGRCLTDPSSGARPGTSVVVTDCTGRSQQRWQLR